MSVEAFSWALKQQAVTDPAARSVLFGLANHANHEGRHAFPSVDLLCSYTGLGRRTVFAKLKLLQDKGLIKRGNQKVVAAIIESADRRPVVYDLVLTVGVSSADVGDEQSSDADESRDAGDAPRDDEPGATDAPRDDSGVQSTTERGAGDAPETSLTNPPLSEARGDGFDRFRGFDDSGQPLNSDTFPMNDDWAPDNDYVINLLSAGRMRHVDAVALINDHGAEALEKFRTKYLAMPGRAYEQRIWHRHYADFLASWHRNLTRQQAQTAKTGGNHANRTAKHQNRAPIGRLSPAEARRAAEREEREREQWSGAGQVYDGDFQPGH